MMNRVLLGLALVLAGCAADSPMPGPGATEVVVVVASTGGCAQLGPNCSRLVVFGDGTVEAYRFVTDGERLVDTGNIEPKLVDELHRIVTDTDLDALRARLPAGRCQGCFDGIDTTMTVYGNNGAEVFDSVDVELDPAEPVFAAAWAVAAAAEAATDIPFLAR